MTLRFLLVANTSLVFSPDKALKESLDQVLLSGYFDRAPAHQNGVREEREPPQQQLQEEEEEEDDEDDDDDDEEEAPAGAAVEPSEVQEQSVEPGQVIHLESCSLFSFILVQSSQLNERVGLDHSFSVCSSEGEVIEEYMEPIEVEATEVCQVLSPLKDQEVACFPRLVSPSLWLPLLMVLLRPPVCKQTVHSRRCISE